MRDIEREQYWIAVHQMRDSFVDVLRKLEEATTGFGSYPEQNDKFFTGYCQAKRLWGGLLLEREIFGPGPESGGPGVE